MKLDSSSEASERTDEAKRNKPETKITALAELTLYPRRQQITILRVFPKEQSDFWKNWHHF